MLIRGLMNCITQLKRFNAEKHFRRSRLLILISDQDLYKINNQISDLL